MLMKDIIDISSEMSWLNSIGVKQSGNLPKIYSQCFPYDTIYYRATDEFLQHQEPFYISTGTGFDDFSTANISWTYPLNTLFTNLMEKLEYSELLYLDSSNITCEAKPDVLIRDNFPVKNPIIVLRSFEDPENRSLIYISVTHDPTEFIYEINLIIYPIRREDICISSDEVIKLLHDSEYNRIRYDTDSLSKQKKNGIKYLAYRL